MCATLEVSISGTFYGLYDPQYNILHQSHGSWCASLRKGKVPITAPVADHLSKSDFNDCNKGTSHVGRSGQESACNLT